MVRIFASDGKIEGQRRLPHRGELAYGRPTGPESTDTGSTGPQHKGGGEPAHMDELAMNRAFLQVVESGSFSAAARQLNISVTSVARQVGGLEDQLGVRLLNRTTRRQSLTEAGHHYMSRLSAFMRDFEGLKREVASYQDGVRGSLKVHMRVSIGNEMIMPALPKFLAANPEVTLDVTLTDDRVDLIAAGVDVAVWLGDLSDSSIIARRLAPSRRVICASPTYIDQHGAPGSPDALKAHNCLVYRAAGYDNIWRLSKDGETTAARVSGNLVTESSSALLSSARAGLGLILVQERMVRRAMDQGDLVQVLSEYVISPTEVDASIYAVYPHRRHVSPKTRVFLDFLADLFRQYG